MELSELNRHCIDGHVRINFSCATSEDGRIFIITESDVVVLSFMPAMESGENRLKFDEFTISCSDYHVANQTGKILTRVTLRNL